MPNTQNIPPMQSMNTQNAPAPNPNRDDEEQQKRGAGFYIGIIIAIVAIVAAVGIGLFMFMNSTQFQGLGGSLGQLDGKTQDEIRAELDKYVEEGMMNISIASVIEFENGTSEGEMKIENSPANRYLMQVEIALADTGEVVYTSDILEPNYHIQFAQLDENLPRGTYPAIATFHALNPDNQEEVGTAAANVTLSILN